MCSGACIWHVKITVANCYEKNWAENINVNENCCCIMHNICIERGDLYDDDCDSDDDSHDEDEDRIVFETGTDVRDALKDFVWEDL